MDEVIFRLQNYYIIASDILLLLLVHSQPEVSTYLYTIVQIKIENFCATKAPKHQITQTVAYQCIKIGEVFSVPAVSGS
ncbi:MAG: hypothetical protein CVT94_02750 [Bacteroidetes bacterium HGW-Bacteroidetes-11]|jgi:hypothetical protein|nr:MAG: hypothetical protein CVT94_02750 [Bacteroidetes bacterium HGW-Bacteroidetes-11]